MKRSSRSDSGLIHTPLFIGRVCIKNGSMPRMFDTGLIRRSKSSVAMECEPMRADQ